MSDINILVDATQVVGGQKALDDLGVAFGKLVTKIVREGKQLQKALDQPFEVHEKALMAIRSQMQQTSAAAARENQKIVNSLLGVTTSYKSAEQSADAFSEVLMNQEVVARRVSQTINNLQGIGGPTAIQGGASFSAMEGELERLTVKYNQVYGASKVYEKSLAELDRAHLLGVISAKQHAAAVDNLNAEYQQFQAGTANFGNRFAQEATVAGRQTNQLGVVVQQTGYQVGDFLVQVQSGTNWMVAFGQQATQLVGTLPLLSGTLGMSVSTLVALSTGLGITIPLVTAIGAYFMRTGESASNASASINIYTEALRLASSEVENLNADLLEMRFPDLSDAQRLLKVQLDEAKLAAEELRRSLEEASNATITNIRQQQGIQNIADQLAAAVTKANELESAYKKISDRQKQLADGASEAARFEEKRRQITESILAPLRREKELREQAKESAERLRAVIASINGMSVNVRVNFEAAYSNFTEQAMSWLGGTFNKMKDMSQPGYMESSPKPRAAPTDIDFGYDGEVSGDDSGGGSSGGGGSTTTIENKMEEIYKYLELEEYQIEQEKIAHKQREEILKTALDNKIITLEEYNKLEKAMVEQHNMDLLEIEMRTKNSRLTELSGMFGQLAGIMQAGGSRTAKIAATFGAVEATINSYVAATDALRKATTIPGKIAAYASVLATGLKGVAAIRSAGGIGGGSGGGGPSASTVATAAGSPDPQTVYIDSIDPEGLYSGQTLINLFDAFYGENDKRGKVFVVAR